MKLVLLYTNTDGYTYSCDVVRPIEYDSPEQAIVDFEAAARESRERKGVSFKFAGFTFDQTDFFYHKDRFDPPEFLTINQWFNSHGAGGAEQTYG
jgi:hypothetical protein